jgi:nudix-type nucleoside diphosphatase (YffH/AdpP family)
MSIAARIRVKDVTVLSDDWAVLKKTTFEFLRSDGTWQAQTRETYDRGNGATILLYDPRRRTVLLTRQFRLPAFVNGWDDLLVETPAGLLDGADPAERIAKELEEETGFRVRAPRKVFEAYMSPGSVTEKLHFFVAPYEAGDRVAPGGGDALEGEDIEPFEVTIEDAMAAVAAGRIADGKTIMLLQYAALSLFRPQ